MFRLKTYDSIIDQTKEKSLEGSKNTNITRPATPMSDICSSTDRKLEATTIGVAIALKFHEADSNNWTGLGFTQQVSHKLLTMLLGCCYGHHHG